MKSSSVMSYEKIDCAVLSIELFLPIANIWDVNIMM